MWQNENVTGEIAPLTTVDWRVCNKRSHPLFDRSEGGGIKHWQEAAVALEIHLFDWEVFLNLSGVRISAVKSD